ncbi:MAG: hypothetical protein ACI4VK_06150 [Candidatus Coproplasma sp.]
MVKRSHLYPKKTFKALVCLALALFGGAIAINPERYTKVCFEGICLWAECVLPSLFPFMVVCSLLSGLGAINAISAPFASGCKKLKINPAALPLFLLSAVSGYPAGSRLVSEYYSSGKLSANEAKNLACACSICSPTFALGTVGYKAFGGGYYGVKLLFSAYVSVIVISVVYSLLHKDKGEDRRLPPVDIKGGDLIFNSFYGAVTAVLTAGGFICFFYTMSQVAYDFNVFAPLTIWLRPILGDSCDGLALGLIEATGGCFAAAKAGGFFALPVAGFLLVFGGASIIGQQLCYLTKCGARAKSFVAMKFIQGLASFTILCVLQLIA